MLLETGSSDKGEHFPITFSEESMGLFTQERTQTVDVFFVNAALYDIQGSANAGNIIFTGLEYTSSDGSIHTQEIGTIEVEILDSDYSDITANSMELNYFSIAIPVFDTVRYFFENNTENVYHITNVEYGIANVEVIMDESIALQHGNVDVEFDVALDVDPSDEVLVYAMKPKYYYTDGVQEKVASFRNVSYWTYIVDFELDIQGYLVEHFI